MKCELMFLVLPPKSFSPKMQPHFLFSITLDCVQLTGMKTTLTADFKIKMTSEYQDYQHLFSIVTIPLVISFVTEPYTEVSGRRSA